MTTIRQKLSNGGTNSQMHQFTSMMPQKLKAMSPMKSQNANQFMKFDKMNLSNDKGAAQ